MRTSAASAVLFTLVLAGCDADSRTLTAPEAPGLAGAGTTHQALEALALTGHCETTFNPPPLPPPPVHRQIDTGTCQFADLGRMAYHGVQHINFAAGTQAGDRTFTAENGDVLRAEGVGTSAPSGPGRVSFTGTFTFVGGTGRFANATGHARVEGVADLPTSTASFTIDGWISYDAPH